MGSVSRCEYVGPLSVELLNTNVDYLNCMYGNFNTQIKTLILPNKLCCFSVFAGAAAAAGIYARFGSVRKGVKITIFACCSR